MKKEELQTDKKKAENWHLRRYSGKSISDKN